MSKKGFRESLSEGHAENLEKAIAVYELALQMRARKPFLEKWAMTQNNLGLAYSERIRGDRAENLEKAITAYELALQVFNREAFPEKWAATQYNLGVVYYQRIRGVRAENLEKAIAAYELALQVHTREAFPEKWAVTQHNLANILSGQIYGETLVNLDRAVSIYKQVAEVFTRSALPEHWAENQSNLAEALTKRALLTDNTSDLDSAIALFQEVLEVATPGSPYFIDAQYRLGNALSRRYDMSSDPQDLERALAAYKTALDIISPEHYDRSKLWQALPTTQSILGSRLVRDGQWQEGLQLLLNSARLLSTEADALAHASTLFEIGHTYDTALSDWNNARLYFRDALRLYTHLNHPLGMAKTRAELGGVLLSQGHFAQGLAELEKAREGYYQLKMPEQAASIDSFYQFAQREIAAQETDLAGLADLAMEVPT
jgi:tetratricopeptide (TPR) repeat protein